MAVVSVWASLIDKLSAVVNLLWAYTKPTECVNKNCVENSASKKILQELYRKS